MESSLLSDVATPEPPPGLGSGFRPRSKARGSLATEGFGVGVEGLVRVSVLYLVSGGVGGR